jgi:hypothetical protein
MNSEKYIGLDVYQATISVAVLDSTGKLVMESILETMRRPVRRARSRKRGSERSDSASTRRRCGSDKEFTTWGHLYDNRSSYRNYIEASLKQ